MADDWYYSVGDGETSGPLSLNELSEMVLHGELLQTHTVFQNAETGGKWVKASQVQTLLKAFESQSVSPEPEPPPVVPDNEVEVVAEDRCRSVEENNGVLSWLKWPDDRLLQVVYFIFVIVAAAESFMVVGSVLTVLTGETPWSDIPRTGLLLVIFPVFFFVLATVYMLPVSIAYVRSHQNWIPIGILNIVFGWTLLGWVGTLAWAFASGVHQQIPRK